MISFFSSALSIVVFISSSLGLFLADSEYNSLAVDAPLLGVAADLTVCQLICKYICTNLICILAAVLGSVAAYAAILLGMKNPLVLEYLEKAKQKFRKIS